MKRLSNEKVKSIWKCQNTHWMQTVHILITFSSESEWQMNSYISVPYIVPLKYNCSVFHYVLPPASAVEVIETELFVCLCLSVSIMS